MIELADDISPGNKEALTQPKLSQKVSGLVGIEAEYRGHLNRCDFFGRGTCRLFNIHPPLGTGHDDRLSRIPVDSNTHIEFLRDLGLFGNEDLPDGQALDFGTQ